MPGEPDSPEMGLIEFSPLKNKKNCARLPKGFAGPGQNLAQIVLDDIPVELGR
jgi:hypothetical protein